MDQHTEDSATLAEGQQVISVCAFIHHNFDGVTKVFLPKRADTKKFLPGLYELPGGHVDYGEDIIAGLKREIQEEFGMTISVGDPFAAFTYKNLVKHSHSIEVIYFATFNEPFERIKINPRDHSTFGWFSKDETIAVRSKMIPETHVEHAENNDAEYQTIVKGFELLEGVRPNFG